MAASACAAAISRVPLFQALRARTATWKASLALRGVQVNVLLVDQGPASTQVVPSNNTNWY